MKKFVLILLAALLISTCALSCVAFANDGNTQNATEQTPSSQGLAEFLQALCENSGSARREFIAEQFGSALREQGVPDTVVQRPATVQNGETLLYVCNIEAFLDNGDDSDDCIVIGAHYDSVGEGANDNASGVTAMYGVLQRLAADVSDLPFDVLFVAFDGEEQGLVGSSVYVDSQIAAPVDDVHNGVSLDSVKVMFNIDSIALGQNLYLACENKSTDLADLICAQSSALREKPYGLGVYAGIDFYGYGYYEYVQNSDHTPFRVAGVPTAAIFSGSYNALGYVDDSGVQNTSDDTFANLGNDSLGKIATVADVITRSVTDEYFYDVAQNARRQLVNLDGVYNHLWVSLAVAFVLILLVVFAWLYYRKLQKRAILGTAEVKTNSVFSKPAAEEIFTFQDASEQSKPSDDNADDIFTFKK